MYAHYGLDREEWAIARNTPATMRIAEIERCLRNATGSAQLPGTAKISLVFEDTMAEEFTYDDVSYYSLDAATEAAINAKAAT